MTPTPKLRFVERVINVCTSPDGTVSYGTKVRILQQWWVYDINYPTEKGEWKDVPCVQE